MDDRVREMLEKVRETAVSVSEAAECSFRQAGKRAGEVLGITRLNMAIFDINMEIDILTKEIGQMIYETHTGKDTDSEVLERKLLSIDEKKSQINKLNEQIAAIKKTQQCPDCKEPCEKGDLFCRRCGSKLP